MSKARIKELESWNTMDAELERQTGDAAAGRRIRERQKTISELEGRAVAPVMIKAHPRQQGSKGPAETSLVCAAAIALVIYSEPRWPRKAFPLAQRASDLASDLGLVPADKPLNPRGPMRDFAKRMIEAIEKYEARGD